MSPAGAPAKQGCRWRATDVPSVPAPLILNPQPAKTAQVAFFERLATPAATHARSLNLNGLKVAWRVVGVAGGAWRST